ncbi:MAG: guanylate kinase [Bifidobacteriaceae bacterium]|nr:guanylate kinase [Bifidobacteriaceae bacterium]
MYENVTVIAGPTSVGKSTIVAEILATHPDIYYSVSATTRSIRPSEIDGKDYHFITDAEFDELIAKDGFLEWAKVHELYRYGTLTAPLLDALRAGKKAILQIDLQGALQIRNKLPDATFIFIAPPTFGELRKRLDDRATESEAEKVLRLRTAEHELQAENEFDYIVVNDDLQQAVAEVVKIIYR